MAKEPIKVGDVVSVTEVKFLGQTITPGQLGAVVDLKEPRKGWNRQKLVIVLLDRTQTKQEFYEKDLERVKLSGKE